MSTMTVKGQVTVPKTIRDALGLSAGTRVCFEVDDRGQVVLRRVDSVSETRPDRFETVRGSADVPWRTDELMALLRPD